MRGVNKTIIVGNLGADPETSTTQAGVSVARFSVGTTSYWTNGQGVKQEHTEWYKIALYDRKADAAVNFLRKGSRVYMEGELRTRKYESNGQQKYVTELHVRDMVFLDGTQQAGALCGGSARPLQQPTGYQAQPGGYPNQPPLVGENPNRVADAFDDDIPF